MTPLNDGIGDYRRQRQRSREINKAFNWHLPEEVEARTVNGIILEALEIPVLGTRVRIEQYDIDITSTCGQHDQTGEVMPVKSLRESVAE